MVASGWKLCELWRVVGWCCCFSVCVWESLCRCLCNTEVFKRIANDDVLDRVEDVLDDILICSASDVSIDLF